ncbi:MAG: hypothetical protein V7727_22175 [Sneathiella sp.]
MGAFSKWRNRFISRFVLCLGVLMAVVSCLPNQGSKESVSTQTDLNDGSNLAQWRQDLFALHRRCFIGAERSNIELEGESYNCTGFVGIQPIVHSSWPNLSATVQGQCNYPKDTRIAGVCEIENGKIVSVRHFKGDYKKPAEKCLRGLSKYRLSDKPWVSDQEVVFDYGFEERNLPEDHEYTIRGIIKWTIYDPLTSRLSRPPLYYVVGEAKERFTCKFRNGEVQGYTFSEVGPLTWDERGRMEAHEFY